jgi:hypothetical protein
VDYLPPQWILLAVISGVVALCVGAFGSWHIMYGSPVSALMARHVCQNVTTIEALEKTRYIHTFPPRHPRRRSSNDAMNAFDIGTRQNWEQVMGEDPLRWFLPIQNSVGNGLAFPVSEDVRGILRGMRSDLNRVERSAVEDDDEEDSREWRRDGPGGKWLRHD